MSTTELRNFGIPSSLVDLLHAELVNFSHLSSSVIHPPSSVAGLCHCFFDLLRIFSLQDTNTNVRSMRKEHYESMDIVVSDTTATEIQLDDAIYSLAASCINALTAFVANEDGACAVSEIILASRLILLIN